MLAEGSVLPELRNRREHPIVSPKGRTKGKH